MEAIVLGQKLQLQAEEMAQLQQKQQQKNDPTAAELLQQAQADLVLSVIVVLLLCVYVCVCAAYVCVYISYFVVLGIFDALVAHLSSICVIM